ncbi:alpha/beta fold hydrolase [Paenibacillus sp. NPDC057967]|uniref:alpha/beta fold hydrolase n=1 Tax=Paenibacillus sp. NPDC057967 TaxID=3346293 RepID=UPI0036DB1E4F
MQYVFSKDGTRIAYDQTGKGPSLILVSGAFGYRKFAGVAKLADLLSGQFTVYNYDRRGRGDSGDAKPYAIEREIEDLEAVIQAAGGSAYVWGLSSGAVLCMQAAARGVQMKKLVLHEPPFVVDKADRIAPVGFARGVTELIATGKRAEAVRYFMTKGMGAPAFVVSLMRLMPGVWSTLTGLAHTLPYDAALLDGHMEGKPLSPAMWQGVAMPTLVLEGTESPASLRRGAQATAAILPNARLVSKKGLGHTKKLSAALIASELEAFFLA